jgi:hypothetical protein
MLWMILTPKRGSEVNKIGSKAQCMAQANEAPIPKASQLILPNTLRKYIKATWLQNILVRFCTFVTP